MNLQIKIKALAKPKSNAHKDTGYNICNSQGPYGVQPLSAARSKIMKREVNEKKKKK